MPRFIRAAIVLIFLLTISLTIWMFIADFSIEIEQDLHRRVVQIALGAIFILFLLIIIWTAYRIAFLPLSLLVCAGRFFSRHIGPRSLLLALAWTAALQPSPFLYLWGWFVGLGRSIVDLPKQIAFAFPRIVSLCSMRGSTDCTIAASSEFSRMWQTIVIQPALNLSVPPGMASAAIFFVIGITCASVLAELPLSDERGLPKGARTAIAMAASFALSLYLAIISIIAIPEFAQAIVVLGPQEQKLQQSLTSPSLLDKGQFGLAALQEARAKLEGQKPTRRATGSSNSSTEQNLSGSSPSIWEFHVENWDTMHRRLNEAVESFPTRTRESADNFVSFFVMSNAGHIGELAPQRHAAVLENSFKISSTQTPNIGRPKSR